jgi:predicted ATPase
MRFSMLQGQYKSFIAPVIWDAIPKLAVLTGANGSGKTQLLELMHFAVSEDSTKHKLALEFDGIQHGKLASLFLRSDWQLQRATAVEQQAVFSNLTSIASRIITNGCKTERDLAILNRASAQSGIPVKDLESRHVIGAITSSDIYSYTPSNGISTQQLAQVLYRYYLQSTSLVMRKRPSVVTDQEIEENLGPCPWKMVNAILGIAGFRHRLTTPEEQTFDQPYLLQVMDEAGQRIPVEDLSSGEKYLVGLSILLFNLRQQHRPISLLLMDEPDAHLHPELTQGFLDAIRTVVVNEFGCTVIMATHRPDTLALCDTSELFEVHAMSPRIRPVASRDNVVARLSANLLAVLPNLRSPNKTGLFEDLQLTRIRQQMIAAARMFQA